MESEKDGKEEIVAAGGSASVQQTGTDDIAPKKKADGEDEQDEDGGGGGEALTNGLMVMLAPALTQLDNSVKATRQSQIELRQQIDSLADELRRISEQQQQPPYDLDSYMKKLHESRRRVAVVSGIMHSCQERLQKLHKNVLRESERKKALLNRDVPLPP